MRKHAIIVFLAVFLFAITFVPQAQNDEGAVPQGIIVQPAESDFSINIQTNNQVYSPKEQVSILVELSDDAFVYIYDINEQGDVTLLFPNGFSRNNFLKAGRHILPPTQDYSYIVSRPLGADTLQAIALFKPIPILSLTAQSNFDIHVFPQLSDNPTELAPQVRELISVNAEPGEWATDWTQFLITEPRANLSISTTPDGSQIYINGQHVGISPLNLTIAPGSISIAIKHEGFTEWTQRISVMNRESKEYVIDLEPLIVSSPVQPAPTTPASPPSFDGLRPNGLDSIQIGFDVGMNEAGIISAGFDLGFASGLGLGGSMTFDEDEVPNFYDLGNARRFSNEQIFNIGPETEGYLKLNIPLSTRFSLQLGGGLAFQEKAHIASTSSTYVVNSANIVILPNGYRSIVNFITTFGGVGFQIGENLLSFGFHNRRGWTAGLTIRF
jgi:hypothetical protein